MVTYMMELVSAFVPEKSYLVYTHNTKNKVGRGGGQKFEIKNIKVLNHKKTGRLKKRKANTKPDTCFIYSLLPARC